MHCCHCLSIDNRRLHACSLKNCCMHIPIPSHDAIFQRRPQLRTHSSVAGFVADAHPCPPPCTHSLTNFTHTQHGAIEAWNLVYTRARVLLLPFAHLPFVAGAARCPVRRTRHTCLVKAHHVMSLHALCIVEDDCTAMQEQHRLERRALFADIAPDHPHPPTHQPASPPIHQSTSRPANPSTHFIWLRLLQKSIVPSR